MRDTVVVVDLGATKTVCLAARRGERQQVEALAYSKAENRGFRKGQLKDVGAVSSAIAEAIRGVEESTGTKVTSVVVSISSKALTSQIRQGVVEIVPAGRLVSRDDILKVVNHSRRSGVPAGLEQVQSIPSSFRIDGQPVEGNPLGQPASRLEVSTFMVFGPEDEVSTWEQAVTETGCELESFVLQPLASGLAVSNSTEAERGVVVIDIGHSSTHMVGLKDGALVFHDTIPVGSGHVTNDIRLLLKTPAEEGERLKVRYGTAVAEEVVDESTIEVQQDGQDQPRPMQRRVFCEIVESRMREIANLCREALAESGHEGKFPGGVLLTGGGSTMPHTDTLFAQVFEGMKVKLANPRVSGPMGRTLARPEMASVVGLARFALDQEDDEFSSANGGGSWKDRIRTLWALFGG